MHRVTRRDLENMIHVTLATMPKSTKRQVRDVLPDQLAAKPFIEKLCDLIDSSSMMVIRTESVGFGASQRPGVWGEDEPSPV